MTDTSTRARLAALAGLAAFVGLAYGAARTHRGAATGSPPGLRLAPAEEARSHAVSPAMAEASRGMLDRRAAPFAQAATDGRTYDLADLLARGPVVLTFTKVGCPCSEAAQPFFNQLAAAYPGAAVLGVVDAESGPASLWCRRLRAAYPHLTDPGLRLVRAYGVENSAYVVLIERGGRVAGHWPGISESMLRDLGARLAGLTSTPEAALDLSLAPERLYSGCPFDL